MIGIVIAMSIEKELLLNRLTNKKEMRIHNYLFITGFITEQEFVIGQSGIGKVNAAICTQIMIDHFNIDYLLNIGISGNLTTFEIGQLIIADKLFYHDVRLTQMRSSFPFQEHFKSDPLLVSAFTTKETTIQNLICGDSFINNDQQKQLISKQFNASIVDMESTAIAHTCYINQTPFLAIRSVSDHANNLAHDDYETNEQYAAHKLQQYLIQHFKNKN